MRKAITKNEYLQLIGLMTIARQYYKKQADCEQAMADIFESDETYGHWTDAIWDGATVDNLLKRMKVEVAGG